MLAVRSFRLVHPLWLALALWPVSSGFAQQPNPGDKSAFDFNQLSSLIKGDQVDLFSGDWSYTIPLGEAQGAGGLSLPINLTYSSAITGVDRLIKVHEDTTATTTDSKGTHTLNNASWVGLGWNLNFGAITVNGGYTLTASGNYVTHPFAFDLSMTIPGGGSHRLVRQLDANNQPANTFNTERHAFLNIVWNYDANSPLASTFTAHSLSGVKYTFGKITIGSETFGGVNTVKGSAPVSGQHNPLSAEFVYQWKIAEVRDPEGNTIRFKYTADAPITTLRNTANERDPAYRSFRNILAAGDLDPRYAFSSGIAVVKTYYTSHLTEVRLASATGALVRKITTGVTPRSDIALCYVSNTLATYDNYFDLAPGTPPYSYGHYLSINNAYYRMLDGIESHARLDTLKVTDGAGNILARYVFTYGDFLVNRPAVAPGDNVKTFLLDRVTIEGRPGSAIPDFVFTYDVNESYRLTGAQTPTGGTLKVVYGQYPTLSTMDEPYNYDHHFYERSRRISKKIWDADGPNGTLPPDTTSYVYVKMDTVMQVDSPLRLERLTFPVVDETLPGGYGTIRHEFVGENDLDGLGLLPRTDQRKESERRIRRGLEKRVTAFNSAGQIIQKKETAWKVTPWGDWMGDWQWWYYPGIAQQAYWVRQDTVATTLDGVKSGAQTNYSARSGLVSAEKTGLYMSGVFRPVRIAETLYHGDDVTYTNRSYSWNSPPTLDSLYSNWGQGTITWNLNPDPYVESTRGADVIGDSPARYTFTSSNVTTGGYIAFRVKGTVGTETIFGGDNMYSEATVSARWSNGSSSLLAYFSSQAPLGGGTPAPVTAFFDTVALVPSGVTSGYLEIILTADVYKPAQSVYRKMRTFARGLIIEGVQTGPDAEDVYLEMAHIKDRPHVVSVKDTTGVILRSATYRMGRFSGLTLPDTTYAWLDASGDGAIQAGEWRVQSRVLAYDALGNPTSMADAAGVVTSSLWRYDQMASIWSVTNAGTSAMEAYVFDDYPSWSAMQAAPNAWYVSSGTSGTILPGEGLLKVSGAGAGSHHGARQDIAALSDGVLEADVMMDAASGDESKITVASASGFVAQVRFGTDGQIAMNNGATLTAIGAGYDPGQWMHVRMEWSSSGWFLTLGGVRYPSSGLWSRGNAGATLFIEFSNTGDSTADSLFVDNARVYPSSARPGVLNAHDPVTLAPMALSDEGGTLRRLERDGLGRVIRSWDGTGRIMDQRRQDFSSFTAYNPTSPNRSLSVVYPSATGYRDARQAGTRTLSGPFGAVEEGSRLSTSGTNAIASGQTSGFVASAKITLKPGFTAATGSRFSARIDAQAAAGLMDSVGTVTFNRYHAGQRAILMGASGTLEMGAVAAPCLVRLDAHPGGVSGTPLILGLDDGVQWVKILYNTGQSQFQVESRVGGTTTTQNIGGSGATWRRVELETLADGTVRVRVGSPSGLWSPETGVTISGLPANWVAQARSQNTSGSFHLANIYVGPALMSGQYYDGLGRLIQTKTATGDQDILTQTRYNRVGQPDSLFGPAGRPASLGYSGLTGAQAGGKITATTYFSDPLSRVSAVIPPGYSSAQAVRSRYNSVILPNGLPARYTSAVDENGVITTSYYDGLGRLVKTVADSGGASNKNATTGFGYDALDQLTDSTMPQGGTSRYVYDSLGRQVKKYQPDADTTRYAYDRMGRLRFSQDAAQAAGGKVTFLCYDLFGRITRVGEAPATFYSLHPDSVYTFESDEAYWKTKNYYDADYAGGVNYAQGRLTKVEENTDSDASAEVTVILAYDREGRVRLKSQTVEGLAAKTVQYAWDLASRITRIIYPDSTEARYTYDMAGRLSRVTDRAGAPYARYTYAPDGNLATHTIGDDLVTGNHSYTLRDWLRKVDYTNVFLDTLAYDLVGNIVTQVYRHGTGTQKTATYSYDPLNRLISFALPVDNLTQSFAYDLSGNITSKTTNGATLTYNYTYGSTPNRLDSVSGTGGMSFTYNQNGAMTGRGANTLSYDHQGVLTGYSDAGGSYTYTVGSDARRVKKEKAGTSSATVYYLRGANGDVLAEYDGNGALDRKYVYSGTNKLAYIAQDTTHYYLTDHLGSTRVVLRPNGSVPARYDYWPYGEVLEQTGEATRWLYTGHERDVESTLDNMGWRGYDGFTGRFPQIDPLAGKYPGISPYAYAAGNPMKYVDPDGREPVKNRLGSGQNIIHEIRNQKISSLFDPRLALGDQNIFTNGQISGRYLPRSNGTFIDMGHFAAAASQTFILMSTLGRHQLDGVAFLGTQLAGVGVEILQSSFRIWSGDKAHGHSAFSEEDIPSNILGSLFALGYDPEKSLNLQLAMFFLENGVITPEEYKTLYPEDYKNMPDSEEIAQERYENRKDFFIDYNQDSDSLFRSQRAQQTGQ